MLALRLLVDCDTACGTTAYVENLLGRLAVGSYDYNLLLKLRYGLGLGSITACHYCTILTVKYQG